MGKIVIVTNCSSTRALPPEADIANMPINLSMREACDWWVNEMKIHSDKAIPAKALYQGVSFTTIAKIIEQFSPQQTFIVSGGTGFCDINEPVTPYDWSSSEKDQHNIRQHVTRETFIYTVWWRMLNQSLGKGPTPLYALTQHDDIDMVIVAVSKRFIKYLVDEISSVPYRGKLMILLPRAALGGVVAQVRAFAVPFERETLANVPGNRNDYHQRALFTLFQKAEANPSILTSLEEARKAFPIIGKRQQFAGLEQLIEDNPELLDLPVDIAYRQAKQIAGRTIGGINVFKGVWRLAKAEQAPAVDESRIAQGVQALTGLHFNVDMSSSEDDEALEAIRVFVESVKVGAPGAVFNASNICNWASAFYKEKPVPPILQSTNKTAFLLKNNASILHLVEVGKADSSAKFYKAI